MTMNEHRVPRHFGTRQKGGLHSTGKLQNTADGAHFKMVNLMIVNFTLINKKESTAHVHARPHSLRLGCCLCLMVHVPSGRKAVARRGHRNLGRRTRGMPTQEVGRGGENGVTDIKGRKLYRTIV